MDALFFLGKLHATAREKPTRTKHASHIELLRHSRTRCERIVRFNSSFVVQSLLSARPKSDTVHGVIEISGMNKLAMVPVNGDEFWAQKTSHRGPAIEPLGPIRPRHSAWNAGFFRDSKLPPLQEWLWYWAQTTVPFCVLRQATWVIRSPRHLKASLLPLPISFHGGAYLWITQAPNRPSAWSCHRPSGTVAVS